MSWRDEPKRWYSVSKCGCAHTSTNHPWVVRQTSLPGECVHVCDDHKPKANPMTDITLEQRAKEIWQFVQDARVAYAGDHVSGTFRVLGEKVERLQDAIAALRLSAGADSARLDALEALLDEQPNGMLLLHHGAGSGRGITGLGLRNTGRNLRAAIDAAAPRHEPGEVERG